jgi:hypothetical protein
MKNNKKISVSMAENDVAFLEDGGNSYILDTVKHKTI